MAQIVGDELLTHHFPLIHAVGRASTHPPRLLDLRWGNRPIPGHFTGQGCLLRQWRLGFEAFQCHAPNEKGHGRSSDRAGSARLIMSAGLPVRLRVLVAAAENAVAGNAFRPGDVLRSRQGLTVEIHNTDAEGRLVLCATRWRRPARTAEILLDFATPDRCGASSVGHRGTGTVLQRRIHGLRAAGGGGARARPCWRLPLHAPYREMLDSKIADIANARTRPTPERSPPRCSCGNSYRRHSLAHFDSMAWNLKTQPGRAEGGGRWGCARCSAGWSSATAAVKARERG